MNPNIITTHSVTSNSFTRESKQYVQMTTTSSGQFTGQTQTRYGSNAIKNSPLLSQSTFQRSSAVRTTLPLASIPQQGNGSSKIFTPPSYKPVSEHRSAMFGRPLGTYSTQNKTTSEPALTERRNEDPQKKGKSLFRLFSKKEDKKSKNGDKAKAAIDAKLIAAPTIVNTKTPPNLVSIEPRDMDQKIKIKVIKVKELYPIVADKIPTYDTKSKYRRGKVLLINNIAFQGSKYRDGAAVDNDNLNALFKAMGFSTTDFTNKSKKDMEKIITNYCKDSSLKAAEISVCVIMSHGNGSIYGPNTFIETIDGKTLDVEWIVDQFSNKNCVYLSNKPKIFIFQCCRGEGTDIQTDATPFKAPRSNADVLLAYATVPGQVSHRNTKLGTWYIQSICKIFMEHAYDTDVENLLKIVDQNLEKNYTHHRQTSSYENRGFKRCYLNPI